MKFTRADLDGASAIERRAVAQRLAAQLGADFVDEGPRGAAGLPSLRHQPTNMSFVLVPSGTFSMGFSPGDARDLDAELDLDDEEIETELSSLQSHATPAHSVNVAAFLLARAPLLHDHARRLLGSYADAAAPFFQFTAFDPALPAVLLPDECARACARAGFRLPSEAEWEYVARELGSRRFAQKDAEAETAAVFRQGFSEGATAPSVNSLGIWGLPLGEWVADGWHEDYDGAPDTSAAWQPGTTPQTFRGSGARTYPWQSPAEVISCHAAWRARASRFVPSLCVRLALSLPD